MLDRFDSVPTLQGKLSDCVTWRDAGCISTAWVQG